MNESERHLQELNSFDCDYFVASFCWITRVIGFDQCPILGIFWKIHLSIPTIRTSSTTKWILDETLSQHGVLQPHIVAHEANIEMDKSYQQNKVDNSYRGQRTIFLRPWNTLQFPSLNLQHNKAIHIWEVSAEKISFKIALTNCLVQVMDTTISCKRFVPHPMGSWPNNEALIVHNDLQRRIPFCSMKHYWITAILQFFAWEFDNQTLLVQFLSLQSIILGTLLWHPIEILAILNEALIHHWPQILQHHKVSLYKNHYNRIFIHMQELWHYTFKMFVEELKHIKFCNDHSHDTTQITQQHYWFNIDWLLGSGDLSQMITNCMMIVWLFNIVLHSCWYISEVILIYVWNAWTSFWHNFEIVLTSCWYHLDIIFIW